MTTDAVNPQTTAGTPATPETPALIPDSPEYRAAMIAKAEGQHQNATPTPGDPNAAPVVVETPKEPVDLNAPVPSLTDEPQEGDASKETPKEGEETKEAPTEGEPTALAKLYESGDFLSGFNAEQLPENLATALASTGLPKEAIEAMHAQFREGQLALARESTGKLYEAAGGKSDFDAVIAWGQKNLTPAQRSFYDQQLNGPDAASAIALLKSKMTAGSDPTLVSVNGVRGGTVSAFRDQSEMVAAMADPRYQESPAFRAEVAARLRVSQF